MSCSHVKKPMVLVYIGDDNPTRGDSHGFKGIGQRMAQKLGGDFHYLEDRHLEERYPDLQRTRNRLQKYFQEHGEPDIVLGRGDFLLYQTEELTHAEPHLIVTEINEYLSRRLLRDKSLVTHHLTPELLHAEGRKFKKVYADVRNPLIVAMIVSVDSDSTKKFVEKIVSKCASYDKCTLFICSSHRTYSSDYHSLKCRIEDAVKEKGLTNRVQIIGYDFRKEREKESSWNPYVGLIDQADHIIVYGRSQSMLSEPLAAGKQVITYEGGASARQLTKRRLAIDFNKCSADTRFESQRIKPIDITDAIAEKLVKKFQRAVKARQPSLMGWMLRTLKIGKKQYVIS